VNPGPPRDGASETGGPRCVGHGLRGPRRSLRYSTTARHRGPFPPRHVLPASSRRLNDPSEPQESHLTSADVGAVTRLLSESAGGSGAAFDEIISLVYDDLRRIAHRRLRAERADHTLNTTAVVHEAYLQLVDQAGADWRNRAHFFAVASKVIRNVLVDYARQRGAQKRGGDVIRIPLREELQGAEPQVVELLALDQALTRLASHDERLERVVECRFFGGMTLEESAEALGVSVRTLVRDWTRAKAYLYRALDDGSAVGADEPKS